jgi:NADH-quinone oxidoreductase subunit N
MADLSLNYLSSLSLYVPEAITLLIMVGLVFLEATYSQDEERKMANYFSYVGLGIVVITLSLNLSLPASTAFFNAVVIDPFSTLMKIMMTIGTIGAIYLNAKTKEVNINTKNEFNILVVGVLMGGMILSSANNMLTVYVGIETLSILSYVLASLKRNNEFSSEAGLKYSLYGGVSAGLMLFGLSHLYGVFGTIQFTGIVEQVSALNLSQTIVLIPSFLLFFVGLGYKIACVPFHMWSPDVYEGSPLPVTAFFSIVPKLAGIAAILRVTLIFLGNDGLLSQSLIGLLVIVSALTMTVGNITAIGQQSVKRMLAYSSISHAGFMLMGVVVTAQEGVASISFYAIVYVFMTLVAFYVVGFVCDHYGNDDFNRFNGLINKHPVMAIMLTISMVSLSGIPPFGGFVAKFNILSAAINSKFYTLAFIGGLNSVISLYYYFKIVRYMIFNKEESNDKVEGFDLKNSVAVVALTVPILVLGVKWSYFFNLSRESILSIF